MFILSNKVDASLTSLLTFVILVITHQLSLSCWVMKHMPQANATKGKRSIQIGLIQNYSTKSLQFRWHRRFSKPKLPQIPGMETFTGNQIHSHNYRRNTPYEDKRLLVVGVGTSGLEISLDCSKVTKKVKKRNNCIFS